MESFVLNVSDLSENLVSPALQKSLITVLIISTLESWSNSLLLMPSQRCSIPCEPGAPARSIKVLLIYLQLPIADRQDPRYDRCLCLPRKKNGKPVEPGIAYTVIN